MMPDHLEFCEKPVLAVNHPSIQFGFSSHDITKLTQNWLKHNSGNKI